MLKNIMGIIISYLFIFIIISLAKLVEKKGKEASRKFIHIFLCFWWLIAMYFFDNVWFAAFVPVTFVIINYISMKKDLIKVMERDEAHKDGFGTVYYALSLLILVIVTFLINKPELGIVGVFTMAFGDGFAAIIGKKIKSKEYKIGNSIKTIAGSCTMLVISFIIFAIFLCYFNVNLWIIKSLVAAILMTILEAISIKGTDNITVPLFASLIAYILI